jgi:1,4-alpha-glucan branching enzyme
VKLDPWLSPFTDALKRRFSKAQSWINTIKETEGGVDKFSKVSATNNNQCMLPLIKCQGTEKFGFNVDKDNNIVYREWAPNAKEAYLIGEFSTCGVLCRIYVDS